MFHEESLLIGAAASVAMSDAVANYKSKPLAIKNLLNELARASSLTLISSV